MVTWSIQGAKPEFDRWSTICQHRTSRESCASLIRKSNRLYCMTILSVIKYYPLHIAYEGKPPALNRSNCLYTCRARADNQSPIIWFCTVIIISTIVGVLKLYKLFLFLVLLLLALLLLLLLRPRYLLLSRILLPRILLLLRLILCRSYFLRPGVFSSEGWPREG